MILLKHDSCHASTLNNDTDSCRASTLNNDIVTIPRRLVTPGSRFHVTLLLRVIVPRWTVTRVKIDLGHNSTLNCQPGSYSTWNSDPSTYLPVELLKVSKFNSVLKIQQLRSVIIQRKIPWMLTLWLYITEGSNFILHRKLKVRKWHLIFGI